MNIYYNLLNKLSWRTIPRFQTQNRFGKFYATQGQALDPDVNRLISKRINDERPLLIGRHGAVELRAITNIYANENRQNIISDSINFLLSKKAKFWEVDKNYKEKLCYNAGFFPNDEQFVRQFSHLFLENSRKIDIYGASTWVEHLMPKDFISRDIPITYIKNLEPWFYSDPWSYQLKDQKVLVVYPLKDLIISQYKNKRQEIFENPKVLPEFDLQVIEAVQTIAGTKSRFGDWFEALEYQKEQMSKTDFDFAIIGAGAYGFPLAAHAKDLGKKAIHFGGATQLLFGIKGKRWMQWERYNTLMNDKWVFPEEKDIPKGAENIENNAYW